VKHRRSDEKREALFHLIEHSTIAIDDNEQYDNYIKRITSLTLRPEEKFLNNSDYPQIKTFSKDKITIDGFLCLHDLSSTKQISDLLFLLHALFKTRRPILLITTKNDCIENQSDLALQFEQSIRRSSSSDSQLLSSIPIIHTSANEHVNIQAVLELALYACDEPSLFSSRKSSNTISKYLPPSYEDAYKNEQSLKHVIQAEYRTLLNRHVLDFRVACWMKFYTNWQHHTSVQNFIDIFGKQQAERLYDEHTEELKRISRQKLIDEKLIPIVELLLTDQKNKLSR
jgi:predicted GTPase